MYYSCVATGTRTVAAGGQQGASAGSGSAPNISCTAYNSPYAPATLSTGGAGLNPGGQGGSILSATQNQTRSGGGWGLAGSGGGAGGAAISGTATLTNSGTIYGAT